MGRLVLGLDIGITSVGYGVIDIDKYEFVDYGVRYLKKVLQQIMKHVVILEDTEDLYHVKQHELMI